MSKRHFTTVDGDTVTTTQVIAATPATAPSTGSDGDDDSFFPDDPIEITVQGRDSIDILNFVLKTGCKTGPTMVPEHKF